MKTKMRRAVLILICLISLSLQATIFVPLALEELAQRAEIILQGTVVSKACLKDPEGRIYTRIEFAVSEVWKGNLPTNTFAIVQAGGTVGDERTVVDGEATYEVGEELVSFLRLNQRGEGVSIGLCQGKFDVWKDSSTGEKFAYNLFHGRSKDGGSPSNAAAPTGTTNAARLSLQELRRRTVGGAR
jgi:hypothetical protein